MDKPNEEKNEKKSSVSLPGSAFFQKSSTSLGSEETNIKQLHKNYLALLGILQNTRVEAQNLWDLLCDLESEISSPDHKGKIPDIVKPYQAIYDNNKTKIDNYVGEMRLVIERYPEINRFTGDDIEIIENKWERFNQFYPDFNTSNEVILHRLKKCIEFLSEIVYQCSFKTIPERLKDHLETVPVGHALDFYDTFLDEVCTREQAEKILQFIACHPDAIKRVSDKTEEKPKTEEERKKKKEKKKRDDIYGFADPLQGMVFRIRPRNEQWQSVLAIALAGIGALALCYLVLVFYKNFINTSLMAGTPFFSQVLVLFTAMMGGAGAHIAIDILKEVRTVNKTRQLQAIDDLLLWVHIKEFLILSGIVILVLGFLTLVISFPTISPETIFVAGYSIDSLGDLYIDRFETVMKTKTDVLKGQLNPS
jgi:hypothetical protein